MHQIITFNADIDTQVQISRNDENYKNYRHSLKGLWYKSNIDYINVVELKTRNRCLNILFW